MRTQGNLYKSLGGYGTLGIEIVISFLLGIFGGRWLDDRYGTTPWFFLGGLVLGSVLSVKAVLRSMKQMREQAEEEERVMGNPRPLYESSAEREEKRKRGEDVGDPVVDRLPDSEAVGSPSKKDDEA